MKKSINQIFGERIYQLRKDKDLSRETVAKEVGITLRRLQSLEKAYAKNGVTIAELDALSNYYKISIDELVKDKSLFTYSEIFINSFQTLNDENKRDVLMFIQAKQQIERGN